ncbi:MAG: hypothetical protein AB7U63_10055 [Porticoccaceae bacterium]
MNARALTLGTVKALLVFTCLFLGSALLLPDGNRHSKPVAESSSKAIIGFFENRDTFTSVAESQNVGDDDPEFRPFELQQLALSAAAKGVALGLVVVFVTPFYAANGIRAPPSPSLLTV